MQGFGMSRLVRKLSCASVDDNTDSNQQRQNRRHFFHFPRKGLSPEASQLASTGDGVFDNKIASMSSTSTSRSSGADRRTIQAHTPSRTGAALQANGIIAERAKPKRPPIFIDFDASTLPRSGKLTINMQNKRQHMYGIGGSLAFFTNWVTDHPNAELIYDAIFSELRPSVLRMRNSYNQPNQFLTSEQILINDRKIVEAAYLRLPDDKPQILMSSWTPPVELKKNGKLTGGGPDAVLKKDASGQFIYKEFAQYWLNSLQEYASLGIVPRWISIQNEPDYNTAAHDVCLFDASESYDVPGYFKAFDMVYDLLHRNLEHVPGMIGPESAAFDTYRDHPYSGHPRIEAAANHLYGAGVNFGSPDFFPRLVTALRNARLEAEDKQIKKLFMSEYANLANHQPRDPLLLSRTIYHTLTESHSGMYLNWDLAWGRGFNEGTLILVENPFTENRESWANELGFERTQSFYWFQHFCRFVRPGMQRVDASVDASLEVVLPLCFVGGDGSSTVILINSEKQVAMVNIEGIPPEMPDHPRRTYRSTLNSPFKELPAMPFNNKIDLEPESITTLYSGRVE